jgi:hypothetical protein
MENLNKFLRTVILAIAVVTLAALAWVKIDTDRVLAEKQLKNTAVDGCMTASRYIFNDKDKGVTTEEPMKDSFANCMKEKGY